MTGPNWPSSGEIDIIEGVNTQSQNRMTMHTNDGCSLAGSNCQGGLGCHIDGGGSSSYGNGLNSANGGTYAMEWTSSQINVWFFSRGSEPSDINSANPNPANWGNPTGGFTGGSGCDIDSYFMNNNIVFDTTFCGDWAGVVFSSDSTCSALASSCQDYVQNQPGAFSDAYWAINYLKVYEQGGAATDTISVSSQSAQPSASVAQPTSSAPFAADNSSIIAQPTASSLAISTISVPATIESPGAPSPTPASPPEIATPTVVTTEILAQTTQASTYGEHHQWHHRPPFASPQVKRSRVARHIKEHAKGSHHS